MYQFSLWMQKFNKSFVLPILVMTGAREVGGGQGGQLPPIEND